MYKCSKCGSDNCGVLYMPVGKMLSEDQIMVPKLNDYVNYHHLKMMASN